eukprot:COSAG05_NODE_20642_length_278_cov_0.569832_1_plen_37_part_10
MGSARHSTSCQNLRVELIEITRETAMAVLTSSAGTQE